MTEKHISHKNINEDFFDNSEDILTQTDEIPFNYIYSFNIRLDINFLYESMYGGYEMPLLTSRVINVFDKRKIKHSTPRYFIKEEEINLNEYNETSTYGSKATKKYQFYRPTYITFDFSASFKSIRILKNFLMELKENTLRLEISNITIKTITDNNVIADISTNTLTRDLLNTVINSQQEEFNFLDYIITPSVNEDFFDDNDITDIETPEFDDENKETIPHFYNYTCEVAYPLHQGVTIDYIQKIIKKVDYYLSINRHITAYTKPILCTTYSMEQIDRFPIGTTEYKLTRPVKERYDEFVYMNKADNREIREHSVGPGYTACYMFFTFEHNMKTDNQIVLFYSTLYKLTNGNPNKFSDKYLGFIGFKNYSEHSSWGHSSEIPTELFTKPVNHINKETMFTLLLPKHVWQIN